MPFTYHPPTRKYCNVCEFLNSKLNPIVSSKDGKASNADNFPLHNWYNFVLGFSPEFPKYILTRENINKDAFVVDPFMGSGTTLVCCKEIGIASAGIDANDFFDFVARAKLNWKKSNILKRVRERYAEFKWPLEKSVQSSFEFLPATNKSYKSYIDQFRPNSITERYVSNVPFAKLHIIKEELKKSKWKNEALRNFFFLTFSSIILPSSNVYYGPGFGVRKPRKDVDVYGLFRDKLERMVLDLNNINEERRTVKSDTILGDARNLKSYFKPNSVDIMITSPPYPGDHEYTKHSRLELMFLDYANSMGEFRKIKKRMLRGSTTNIYKSDHEGELVSDLKSIQSLTNEIDSRIKEDNGTSGFEKLYTKLVWEYFGGMYKTFQNALDVLKPGGKFVLLVSDSHAFKMVHIQTAKLLSEVAERAGFIDSNVELWQLKNSTSHGYKLYEEILTVQKPFKKK